MAAPSSDPVHDLKLEAPEVSELARIRRLRAETYRHPISVYCQTFGRRLEDGSSKPLDRKTVERWIRTGRESEGGPDLPPLDAPADMAEWYRRNYGRQVPEVLLVFEDLKEEGAAAVEGDGGEPVGPPAAGKVEDGAKALEAFKRACEEADKDSIGAEAGLNRARAAERLAFHQWQVVQAEPEKYPESLIAKRKKAWEDVYGLLLRAEEKAEKILDQSSEWGRWEELEAAVLEREGYVARGVRSLLTRVAAKETLPPGTFASLNKRFQEEVDQLFEVLAAGDFRELLELDA